MQVVSGFVTAPDTTFTAWTMAAGDTLAVRNAADGSKIHLLNAWADNQAAGFLRIRSALLHDNVVGITAGIVASEVQPLMPMGMGQILKPQDLLIVEQRGSATAGDIESGSLLVYYEDLPGANARLARYQDVVSRIESYMYVTNTLATGTAGGYSGEEAINAEVDQWKANRDYALLGYLNGVECSTIGWRGPDTSNLRVGGPGTETFRDITANWFVTLSMSTGLATIPIINAANKAATLIDCTQDENGADPIVTSIFALLSSPFAG
jgi:hypothetical protein